MGLEEAPCIIQRICAPSIQLSPTASPHLYLPHMCAYCKHKHTQAYAHLSHVSYMYMHRQSWSHHISNTCSVLRHNTFPFISLRHINIKILNGRLNIVHWADVSLDVVKIKVGALSDTVYRVGTILYQLPSVLSSLPHMNMRRRT